MSFKALDHSSRIADPAVFAAVLRYLPILAGTLARDVVGPTTEGPSS